MSVPKLRFKADDGSEFPEWEGKKLSEVAAVTMGQSPDSVAYNTDCVGLPLVQGNADMTNRMTTPSRYTTQITKVANVGDILMSVRAPVGVVGLANLTVCCGRGVCAIRALDDYCQDYVYQLLLYLESSWEHIAQGGTFTAISKDDICFRNVSIPSLPEQRKIASFLSAIDTQLELSRSELSKWEQFKKGMLQKIFHQEIRFKADDRSVYPEWEEKRLGEVCDIKTGSKDANAMTDNGKYVFFTCSKKTYLIDTYSFDGLAILISGNGDVGQSQIYNGKFDAYQRTYVLMYFLCNVYYLKNFIDFNLPKKIQKELCNGVMPYIKLSTLTDMQIKLPDMYEQQKIADLFSSIDQMIEHAKQEVEYWELYKNGLLQQMFV